MKKPVILLLLLETCTLLSLSVAAQDNPIRTRLNIIRNGLDSMIFVNRFESVETPCLCISEKDSTIAQPNRLVINSNSSIKLAKRNIINPNGVKCLSQHIARYLRFRVMDIFPESLTLTGTIESTYAYPAGSIIQMLGFTRLQTDNTERFFNRLIRSRGTFILYPEGDRYRIRMILTDEPYNAGDTYIGYLEIVRDAFDSTAGDVYVFNFDQMSIARGDKNNQIAVKFSTTSHSGEQTYYSVLAYNVLKNENSTDSLLKANAVWLKNFLNNPRCPQCQPVYSAATLLMNNTQQVLPNTGPTIAH